MILVEGAAISTQTLDGGGILIAKTIAIVDENIVRKPVCN